MSKILGFAACAAMIAMLGGCKDNSTSVDKAKDAACAVDKVACEAVEAVEKTAEEVVDAVENAVE